MSSSTSRRSFLRQAAAFSSLGAAGPLGLSLATMGQASAQSAGGGYQALVCIFLNGGNDSYNTVLATDTDSWGHYVNHRDPHSRDATDSSTSIALLRPGTAANPAAAAGSPERLGGVRPIAHSGRSVHAGRQFALHPALVRSQQLYDSNRLAVMANVGPLMRPTTKANYAQDSFAKPAKLFSHNDQQSTWMSFSPEGASEGWGGRIGDLLMSGNGSGASADIIKRSFTCITPGNASTWLSGRSVRQYPVGLASIPGLGNNQHVLGNADLYTAVKSVMNASTSSNLFTQAHQQVVTRAIQASNLMAGALPASALAPWGTSGASSVWNDPMLKYTNTSGTQATNGLALQLQMIARIIDANRQGSFGIRRQVFMVNLGSFDTHASQNTEHNERMLQLDHALAYFDSVMGAMPGGDMRSQVTTFTASDFGRSFTNNGDGTDHGWGAHHLIMGGAVQGGEVYGTFPQYSTADANGVFASLDQLGNGALLPTTSVDQYAYTLGKWMGVSPTDLASILPNLHNFDASAHNVGFMG
ncbi:DUF1501 domain-containing protein [Aquabacterium sp.]|uniref:DUF1501 domain-containing protein n=1 Tax=Aquabacterium sp. TaxID=1872578 RepID=UPI00198BBBE4|nr:DUF1501 domain-containing protein [Aquabacterium sp.]MBC7701817.1 DUF1501 domain-containing protein [Aquabacterium sp.]